MRPRPTVAERLAAIRAGRQKKTSGPGGFTAGIVAPSLGGVSPLEFLRQVQSELKRVRWATRRELVKLTVLVVAVSVAVGAFIGSIDYFLTKGLQVILK